MKKIEHDSERRTLRLFLKGNRDVMDSLLPLQNERRAPGRDVSVVVEWKHEGRFDFQVSHETGGRADSILQAHKGIPEDLLEQGFDGDCRWISDQFESRLFEDEQVDVVVLTLQPNITDPLWRHGEKGYLFCPTHDWENSWSAMQKQWLMDSFSPAGLMRVDEFEACFQSLVRAVKERLNARILVFNCSSVDPADRTFRYSGIAADPLSVRAHKFNLALMGISALEGISIIDIDRIVGEAGADRHVREFLRYSEDASRAIGRECLRVMEDIGVFESNRLIAENRLQKEGGRVLRLVMPFVHRLAHRGTIVRWHRKVGEYVRYGDDLVDIDMQIAGRRIRSREKRIQHLIETQDATSSNGTTGEGDGPGIVLSVRATSTDSGFLRRIDAMEGGERNVDDLLAVVTTDDREPLDDGADAVDKAGTFRVVVNIVS